MVENLYDQLEDIHNSKTKFTNYSFSQAFVEGIEQLVNDNMDLQNNYRSVQIRRTEIFNKKSDVNPVQEMPLFEKLDKELVQKRDLGKLRSITWRENPKKYVLEAISFHFDF